LTNNRVCQSPSSLRLGGVRESEGDCYSHRVVALPPYYFSLEYPELDGQMLVSLPPDNQIFIEDSPPSYEMALLCPNVPLSNPGQLQPPPPYNEKNMKQSL